MRKRVEDLSEQDYREFFEWLLEKDITLYKELDLSLCSTQNEPYIFFPKEIEEFLQTAPMQRLKKITQLGTGIVEDPNVYHTRYAHSLGTYNNAVIFYMLQFRNNRWRSRIESENRKLEVLADIMESLRHDDGHNILSHSLEKLIGKEKGLHEILGARFKEEYEPTIEALNKIHPDLCETMKRVSSEDYPLILLREGNLDFDRLDFLARDIFYLGKKEQRELVNRLIKNSSIQTVIKDGKKQEIVVYEYEALTDIEEFLNLRAMNYKEIYTSNTKKGLDILEEEFCRRLIKSDSNVGQELKDYLKLCISSGAENLDLSKFISWNDIRYFNELFSIAVSEPNEDLRELALACMPSAEGLYALAIEMIDPKNRKEEEFTENEKNFLKNLRDISEENNILHKALYEDKKSGAIVLNSTSVEDINSIVEELKMSDIDIKTEGLYFWKKIIRKYNPEEPIYVKARDGKIYTLDEHPERTMDLTELKNYGAMIVPSIMRLEGVSKEKMDVIRAKFDDFNKEHTKQEPFERKYSLRLFKVGNKPYIPEYEEK